MGVGSARRLPMTTSPKKPGVAFWATVAVVVVAVLYVGCFGPACWGYTRSRMLDVWFYADEFYYPILLAWHRGPPPAKSALSWYANLYARFPVVVAEGDNGGFLVIPLSR